MPEKVTIIYHEVSNLNNKMLNEETPPELGTIYDTALSVRESLNDLGYTVDLLEIQPPVTLAEEIINTLDTDIVFNLFEGFDGWPESEAAIVSHLENLRFCFTGSPSHTLRTCENKAVVKETLKAHNIPTPEGKVFHPCRSIQIDLSFPCIVKPLGEHGSYGITEDSVVNNPIELRKQVEYIWTNLNRFSLVEEFLPGREFRALVTGNRQLKIYPIEEIIYSLPPGKPELLTYAAKWLTKEVYFSGTQEKCPVEASSDLMRQIEHLVFKTYRALGCRNYASIDVRVNGDGQVMVIDVNPNTDIYMDGGIRFPLEASGTDYVFFIGQIVQMAKEAHFHYSMGKVEQTVF